MEPSGQDLLQRMRAGDEAAFVSLYRRRQAGVYRFALHMSGSAAVAEDVTQEVFLALMRDPAGFDPARGSLAAWLYGIARNHVRRWFERGRPGTNSGTGYAIPNLTGRSFLGTFRGLG